MKFFVNHELPRNRPLRAILLWSLVFMALFWVTNGLFYSRIGLVPGQISLYYRGSAEAFRAPRSFLGLLEETHFHLFAMMIFLMTLNHLMVFTRVAESVKQWLIHLSFAGALADISAGWLIRFVHPIFAWLKILAFLTLQLASLTVMALVLRSVWTRHDRPESPAVTPERSP